MDNNPKTFQIGDTVTWTSQAGGKSKTKTGRVVVIIRPYAQPRMVSDYWDSEHRFRLRFEQESQSRKGVSYLIEIADEKRLYWPLVKYLEKVPETFTMPNEMPEEGATLAISKVTEKGYEMEWRKSSQPNRQTEQPEDLENP